MKEAKKAVREAKLVAFDNAYKRLDTKEGELEIYKLARVRERKTSDLNQIKCIKIENWKCLRMRLKTNRDLILIIFSMKNTKGVFL